MARTEHLPLPALGHLSHGLLTSPRKRLQPPRQGPRSRMLEANPGSARPLLCICVFVSLSLSLCLTVTHTTFLTWVSWSHPGTSPPRWLGDARGAKGEQAQ